ncbi:hypothetical protein ELH06_38655 [Rhizobium ruizarguesonis]|nr:hypothetical protein ELH54_37115 [Rhizobium ruizarguesonis]TBB35904.1 hypothetical protein ELH46_37850 [Rhizobium ruizarguesonis]TBE36178.1 hypothetical protein ELH06_38655 [Rhizobium ruizarguesonis]
MRRRHQRHPAGDDFRQNLDPLQIALAHRYQSHPQSPRSSNPGSVTFQLCRNRTLQLCGYKHCGGEVGMSVCVQSRSVTLGASSAI